MIRASAVWTFAGVLLAFPPSWANAQAGGDDHGEVSAQGGVTFGGGSPGIGAQPTVTAASGAAFSRYGMVLIGATYMPLGNHTIQNWPSPDTINRSHLMDFGVDFHIRIPVRDKWEPYFIAGGGVLWNFLQAESVNSAGARVVKQYDQVNGAFHTGGGVRYYVGEQWGIRPEVKVIVSKQIYTSISMGVFYSLPAGWP